MGAWGFYSEDNDDTLNLLHDDLNLDQNKVDVLLSEIFDDFTDDISERKAIGQVGVVMTILRMENKLIVEPKYLKMAILLNKSFLECKSYEDWDNPLKRKQALVEEIEIMEKVILTNGKVESELKPSVGLIETILRGEKIIL